MPSVTDPNAWFNYGIAYFQKKDYELAIEAFTKSNALKADPQTLFNRALAYYSLGEAGNASAYALAQADAANALAMKSDYPDAVLIKADAEYAEKNYSLAAADYRDYAGQTPVSPENKLYAQKRMLQATIDNKDFAGAIAATTSLIQSNPAEPQNYFIRGTACVAMKKFDSAIRDLVKYTGMKADDSMGWYNLGLAYMGDHDTAHAAASYEKGSAVKADNYDAAEQAGTAYKMLADGDESDPLKIASEYDSAIRMYDKAARIPSATPKQRSDALYNEAAAIEAKARRLKTPGSLRPAVDVWDRWLKLASSDPELATIRQHLIDLQATLAK